MAPMTSPTTTNASSTGPSSAMTQILKSPTTADVHKKSEGEYSIVQNEHISIILIKIHYVATERQNDINVGSNIPIRNSNDSVDLSTVVFGGWGGG